MLEPERGQVAPVASQPPDQAERSRALDPARSFLVQAPAGSGKTYLLTQRFLRLLAQAEKPDEIVAITFTNAAAAEMRNRILDALEKAESEDRAGGIVAIPGLKGETWGAQEVHDPESLPALAAKALERAKLLGWQILDQPGQLRITTIDAFCRSLALQSPLSWGLLAGLGGRLDPVSNPDALYRRAATRTIELLRASDSPTRRSVEAVLLWRDNNWKDVENLIVEMLAGRNRWYQEFVFARDGDWEALRKRLETPFCRTAHDRLRRLRRMLDGLPGSREFALNMARFACENPGKSSPRSLAERAELPTVFIAEEGLEYALILEDAVEAYRCLACFLLTEKGEWRKKGGLNVHSGFPAGAEGKAQKERFGEFVEGLAEEPGLLAALAAFQQLMPVRYTDAEWELIRHCFAVLRFAAGQLQVVFAEAGSVDFTEVAQIALRILAPENGFPSDFAMRQADGIRHLLIDEFQDTSRNQHQLLARLIAAWPEREGRSCFCVGDPMQSIYSFREAEVELFERLKTHGLDTSSDPLAEPFRFEFVSLRANFRTAPSLVNDLNGHFGRVFAEDDGSGVHFSPAKAARESRSLAKTELHLAFTRKGKADANDFADGEPETTRQAQLDEIVALVRRKLKKANELRSRARLDLGAAREKYRIAVLGRTRSSLVRIAEALRAAGIAFRAIELVPLRERPEVLDVLSLARALLNPTDRTAWLGVLRAPWCGLSLAELHLLTSADDPRVSATPIPTLLKFRLPELFEQGLVDSRAFASASRVGRVLRAAVEGRSTTTSSSPGTIGTTGTRLQSVWKALGGGDTVDAEQRENLRLLWAALDKLPDGELDLLGPGLNAALDELYALPNPAADSDFGVQLMTIHKSKGLEFEVVVVPDLEAEGRKPERTMISWLERGRADSDSGEEDDQLTEFLIAPIQAKGTDVGAAKKWVDGVKREREKQELRRVLYVAATRAREELYLFARPRFSISKSEGMPALGNPTGLLATAWPALGDAVEVRFAAWLDGLASAAIQEPDVDATLVLELETLAAEADGPAYLSNLLQMSSPVEATIKPAIRPTVLRRLPEGHVAPELPRENATSAFPGVPESLSDHEGRGDGRADAHSLYTRNTGGLESRLLGTAVHALLEQSSRLRRSMEPVEAALKLADSLPAIAGTIRSGGLHSIAADRLAAEALAVAQRAAIDPVGVWILAPHASSEVEARWTGLVQAGRVGQAGQGPGQQWNLRPDRVFFASLFRPEIALLDSEWPTILDGESEPGWWIIDYKTSHASGVSLAEDAGKVAFLNSHREQHSRQLAVYAEVLRGLLGEDRGRPTPIRVGIYYPRLLLLDFWEC